MDNELNLVLDVFSNSGDLIRKLHKDDDKFRSMCRDYADAINAIQTWRQSAKVEAPIRIKEYQTLVGELREDMEKWLEKVKKRGPSFLGPFNNGNILQKF